VRDYEISVKDAHNGKRLSVTYYPNPKRRKLNLGYEWLVQKENVQDAIDKMKSELDEFIKVNGEPVMTISSLEIDEIDQFKGVVNRDESTNRVRGWLEDELGIKVSYAEFDEYKRSGGSNYDFIKRYINK